MMERNGTGYGAGVGTVYAIGRSYAGHARELGNTVPAEPIVFLKPAGSVWRPAADGNQAWEVPTRFGVVNHEIELVVRVGRREGLAVAEDFAVGLDLTARELQSAAQKQGLPWAVAKGLRGFAPISEFRPVVGPECPRGRLELRVNGEVRQAEETSALLFSVERQLAWLDARSPLEPGDLVFTGTPPGVGPLVAGDRVEARFVPASGGELKLGFVCA